MSPTPVRKVRVDDDLWRRCMEKAQRIGTDVSTVIRDKLREWLEEPEDSGAPDEGDRRT